MSNTKIVGVSENVISIIDEAAEIAAKRGQSWCNTTHLFNAFLIYMKYNSSTRTLILKSPSRSFVKYVLDDKIQLDTVKAVKKNGTYHVLGEDTEIPITEEIDVIAEKESSHGDNYRDFANDFMEIISRYGINSLNFSNIFAVAEPSEEGRVENSISIEQDINAILQNLYNKYVQTGVVQDVYDLLIELFNDRTYAVATLFDLLGAMHVNKESYNFKTPIMFDTDAISAEFIDLGNKYKLRNNINTLKDLDKIPYLRNLNKAIQEKPQLMLEADSAINKMEIQLNSAEYPCMVLVGASGVGKTSLVLELARRINIGAVSNRLKDRVIYEMNINEMVAGSKFRGDFEQRCKVVFDTCKKNKNAILFIDEGHMIASAGSSKGDDGGDLSLGNILKPYISRGDVTIITATTSGEYKHFEKDKALCGRFQRINIQEPTKTTMEFILKGIVAKKQKDYNILVEDKDYIELVDYVLTEGPKFLPNEANPKRSLKLLDGAFAYASQQNKNSLTLEDLKNYLISQYGVTISDNKAEDTRQELLKELLGQTDAINRICDNLAACELGLVNPEKPLYSMILAGPTGTGKTHAAKAIAKYFFGNENNYVTIDMSQYGEAHTVSNLIGAAKGYVGYSDEPILISKIKQNPNSVIIFDEVEKAHPNIFPTFLRILDEGELDDAHGNRVSFRNAIIIFTTNLGFDHKTSEAKGAGLFKEVSGTTNVLPALKSKFPPEFLGRINDIIIYNYLPESIVRELIDRATKTYLSRLKSNYNIEYTEEDIEWITKTAKVSKEGARNIDKAVQRILTKKIIESKRGVAKCTI